MSPKPAVPTEHLGGEEEEDPQAEPCDHRLGGDNPQRRGGRIDMQVERTVQVHLAYIGDGGQHSDHKYGHPEAFPLA